ncbi:MAG: hypothetical protein ACRDWN_08830, partial [Acidimicrobiales bacterium]
MSGGASSPAAAAGAGLGRPAASPGGPHPSARPAGGALPSARGSGHRHDHLRTGGRARAGWSAPRPVDPGRALIALSCPAPGDCVALDSAGAALVERASRWSEPVPGIALPVSAPSPGYLSCPSVGWCLAVHSADEVISWSAAGEPAPGWGPPVA